MNLEWLRETCLAFPGVTEQVQWEHALLFKIGGKMFAVGALEPGATWLSLKVSPENFAELTERPGIIPAPYLARAQWVALETSGALRPDELTALLRESYDLISAKLPRKTREALASALQARKRSIKNKSAKKKTAPRKSRAADKRVRGKKN
jgi:predicted DNA-binding protein (MmcQ/YjbR family)